MTEKADFNIDKQQGSVVCADQTSYGAMLLLILLVFSTHLLGHEWRPTVADVSIDNDTLQVSLKVDLEALISGVSESHKQTHQTENYNHLRTLPAKALEAEFLAFAPDLLDRITLLTSSGKRIHLDVYNVSIPAVGNSSVPRKSTLVLSSSLASVPPTITWQWDTAFSQIIIRTSTVKTVSGESDITFSELLQPGATSSPIPVSQSVQKSGGQ